MLLSGCNAVANNPTFLVRPKPDPSDAEHIRLYQGALAGIQSYPYQQGQLFTTDKPLQLAIDGPGFFILKHPSGQIFYTRKGAFQVNALGQIVSPEGLFLLPEVQVNTDSHQLNVSEDGSLWTQKNAPTGAQLLGRIKLAYFPNPRGLLANGANGLLQSSTASGQAGTGQPGQNGFGLIIGGAQENFTDPIKSLPNSDCLQPQTPHKTGRNLDWSIDGSGYFVLFHPLTGELLFSRHGSFEIASVQNPGLSSPEGEVINPYGYRLFEAEQYIQTSESRSYGIGGLILTPEHIFEAIDATGELSVRNAHQSKSQAFGQIKLAFFDDPSILEPMGLSRASIFRIKPEIAQKASDTTQLFRLARPGEEGLGRIQAESLEECQIF